MFAAQDRLACTARLRDGISRIDRVASANLACASSGGKFQSPWTGRDALARLPTDCVAREALLYWNIHRSARVASTK
jgi:hypothetical protein